MQWRDMTGDEVANHPDRQLGGALLWMTIACGVAVVVPLLGVCFGGSWLAGPRRIGEMYMISVIAFMAWSAVFVVMTLMRARATPVVASIGIVLWVVLRIAVNYVAQGPAVAMAEGTTVLDGLIRVWPYAIAILAEVALAAGFCGYMATGVRPNAYYRRRLPTA
jgi:ABC-type transport system involved in multi-copper enzyme maturation permease subunit